MENIDGLPELPFKAFDGQGGVISTLGRGALKATINVQGKPIHIITAHLKSKLLTYAGRGGRPSFVPKSEDERARVGGAALTRRAAEAAAVRMRANTLLVGNANDGVIVLGDLNDTPEAATTQILNGPEGSQPVARAFDLPDKGDDARLFNLANFIPQDRRGSRIHAGVSGLLDQIFVSEELVPVGTDGRRPWPTVDTHADLLGGLPSVTEANPNERRGKPLSDHAPVTAVFPWV